MLIIVLYNVNNVANLFILWCENENVNNKEYL